MINFQKILPSLTISFLLSTLSILSSCGNPTINILMKCTEDSNGSNAVQMKLYQLRSSEKFKLSSRESLLRNAKETLGEDFIPNTKVEKIMIPGETFNLEDVELTDETKFIGVVGDFFLPVKDRWSLLINVSDSKDDTNIIIGKNFLSVTD
ncbi:MAG: type VI secretion system lipoprotein TssJ [Melioribacteraceae bacterium]